MIKIEAGKYYRTTDGKKVGSMMPSLKVDWPWIVSLGDGFCWHDDGSPVAYTESPRLIAEWVDGVPLKVEKENPKLWRDMTPEEKGALLLAEHEGKTVEYWDEVEWQDKLIAGKWGEDWAYRVRHEPKRRTVTLHGSGFEWGQADIPCAEDTHRITFDIVDGEPDCASIMMEKL